MSDRPPGHDPTEEPREGPPEEEDEERRRALLLWWFFAAIVLIIVIVFVVISGGDDDAGPAGGNTSAVPTTEAAPTTTTAAPAASTTTIATTTTEKPTIDGVWTMTVDVSVATGACRGEEEEEAVPDTVTVRQDGDSFTILGLGFPEDEQLWHGEVDGTAVTFSGERVEDDGTTTASFTLEVDFENQTMSGVEHWTWEGPGGSCPDSESVVTAVRVGD